jgi:hypothetical protein
MLYDFSTRRWEDFFKGHSGYPNWTKDSKCLYLNDPFDAALPIYRICLNNRKPERIVNLSDVGKLAIGSFGVWTGDARLRDLLIRFVHDSGDSPQTLAIAVEGAKLDPTNWGLQRWLAPLRKEGAENVNAAKGHHEAAIRHHKGDVGLMVEHAAYLFMKLLLPEAKLAFEALKDLSISTQERRQIRERWKQEDGTPMMFTGRIQRYTGARGTILAIPDNFEAFFWRIEGAGSAREGEIVRFTVSFSAQGAEAKLLKVKVTDRLTAR